MPKRIVKKTKKKVVHKKKKSIKPRRRISGPHEFESDFKPGDTVQYVQPGSSNKVTTEISAVVITQGGVLYRLANGWGTSGDSLSLK